MVAVAHRKTSFTRGSNCKALTGKNLVFWIGGRLWEVSLFTDPLFSLQSPSETKMKQPLCTGQWKVVAHGGSTALKKDIL